MSFELEHDWQATFATPKPRIGEAAKIRLLLLLCALWLGLGLIGHQPWKPDEAQAASVVKHILASHDLVELQMAGQPAPQIAPLYYLSAAGSAALFSPWLSMHDAARLASAFWMALTLLMVGMTGRELWGQGSGRQTTLVFLASIGLVISAHMLTPDIAGLTGYAMAFYALALSTCRPLRAGLLLGAGCGIAFLAAGTLALGIVAVTAITLPLVSSHWRGKAYATVLLVALITAAIPIAGWLMALWQQAPQMLQTWLAVAQPKFGHGNLLYLCKTLSWYTWPALPLAAWLLWRERQRIPSSPPLQLALTFLSVLLIALGSAAENRVITALPLLLPIAIIGGGAVDTLRRGAASALDWFGITLFGLLGFTIWLGWFAMMSGFPAKTAARMHKLSSAYVPQFSWSVFLAGLILTLLWLLVVSKGKRSNRAIVTDWAVGITMTWGLLMTLWLPWLDSTKSYRAMIASMEIAMPSHPSCVTVRGLGSSQRAILDYYTNLHIEVFEASQQTNCDLYLIQDEKSHTKIEPGEGWNPLWNGRRPSDRRESFRLFQHSSAVSASAKTNTP